MSYPGLTRVDEFLELLNLVGGIIIYGGSGGQLCRPTSLLQRASTKTNKQGSLFFRRVMAEQRDLERKAQLAAKEQEEMEQDARLETLRKTTRRRMGIGILRNKGEENQTAMLPTVASALKIREKVIIFKFYYNFALSVLLNLMRAPFL